MAMKMNAFGQMNRIIFQEFTLLIQPIQQLFDHPVIDSGCQCY